MRKVFTGWRAGRGADGLWRVCRTVAAAAWRSGRSLTTVFVVVGLASGALPILQMIMFSVVVGQLNTAIHEGTGAARCRFFGALTAMAVSHFMTQVIPVVQWSLGRVLGMRMDALVRLELIRLALGLPGLGQLGPRAVTDAVTLARNTRSATTGTDDAVRGLAGLVAGRLQGIVAATILARFHWWAPAVLLLTFLPWDAYFRAEHRKVARSWVARTPDQARAEYFRRLGTDVASSKELRVFGISGFVFDRFTRHAIAGLTPLWRERTTSVRRFLPRVLLVIGGYVVVFGTLGWEFAEQRLSLTTTTLYLLMAGQVWRLVPSFNDLTRLTMGAAPLLAVRAAIPAGSGASPPGSPATGDLPDRPPVSEIRFEKVSFAYPGGDPVLRECDLVVGIGQSLAIVGANGAGKTTLVKLMCGLYQPTAGRITVDGVDLWHRDLAEWRRHLAAVFQDYVRFPLSVRDNVAWGADGALDDEDVFRAMAEANGADLVAGLPRGIDTSLAPELGDGVDLSGGQWQKIAVARALGRMRAGASVLILDEPTANLDVRTEAVLFERILDLCAGRTTLLVSHRFANVRRAQRVVVLDGGKIIEDGAHDELMALDGLYARMFRSQATNFRQPTAVATGADQRSEER